MDRFAERTPEEEDCRYVSTAQAAEALGVGVTTVKRWVNEGILPAHKTAGGHRKLLMADVLRFARDGKIPQADLSRFAVNPDLVDYADAETVRKLLIAAITKADADTTRSLLHGAYEFGHALEWIADQIVAPSMGFVGHEWEVGRWQVIHEHRATQAVVSAMYELNSRLRVSEEPDRPTACGGAPEHDHSILASLMARLVLADSGWQAINLGPHTPMSAFHAALDQLQPKLMWLSVTHVADSAKFLEEFQAIYRHAESLRVPIAIGGRGLTQELRSRMAYTTFGDGLTHLAAFAKTIYRLPTRPRRGRPASSVDE